MVSGGVPSGLVPGSAPLSRARGAFVLAVHRHASNLTNPLMQRSCIRIMLIGPVYSALCILALWKPELDLYVSIPIGIYEGYTMLSFFETIVIYLGGERKVERDSK